MTKLGFGITLFATAVSRRALINQTAVRKSETLTVRPATPVANTARLAFLALGSNIPGQLGAPHRALQAGLRLLATSGVQIITVSTTYKTSPVGGGRQPDYLNAVLAIRICETPAMLLRKIKRIERQAGRRLGRHWGPRPLDIDIIAVGGRVIGWPVHRRRIGIVTVPHPEAHRRAFVLVPLLEIAPTWVHPALQVRGRRLLHDIGPAARRIVAVTTGC